MTQSSHITYNPAYNTVGRDDFRSLIEVDRYGDRSTAFDAIISATEDHFWDPNDPAYRDFTENSTCRSACSCRASSPSS